MNKRFPRASRRAWAMLVLSALVITAGLVVWKALPVEKIFDKVGQKAPLLANELFRDVYYGLAPGTPETNETNLPAGAVLMEPAVQVAATGPLKQSTVNKRYFADPTGKIIYLTGSHTWSNLQDNGGSNPPPVFNYTAYLNFLQTYNHNFFRLWVWEQARWTVETDDNNYWFSPMPYQRTGPGTARDGSLKYDLTKFNQAYFDRLRSRIIAAGDRGIYVSIMLFDGWSIEPSKGGWGSGKNPWLGHPYNINNNIQGANGDPNGDNDGEESHTLAVPAITSYQKAYIKKVIDTVNDLDNVLYEITNESHSGSTAWQYEMINYIHTYEASKPKQHPVGMTFQYPDGSNASLEDSPADWISPWIDMNNPPVVSGTTTKVLVPDTDHLCGVCVDNVRDFTWKSFTRGYNPIYMDPYDAAQYGVGAVGTNPNDPNYILARKNLGYARAYAERMKLGQTVPSMTICSTGYCLVNNTTGSEKYLVYIPPTSGGTSTVTVDLRATPGNFYVEWFNPYNDQIEVGSPVAGGQNLRFTSPFSNFEAVLYLCVENKSQPPPSNDLPLKIFLPVIFNSQPTNNVSCSA